MTEAQEAEVRREILARILETKRTEVQEVRARSAELRSRAGDRPPARGFERSIRAEPTVGLIAEVKRRSPGAGPIRPDLDPAALARRYEEAGARALSILTDRPYFGGTLHDLARARQATGLPALRKDFILDEVQVWEARAADADAVLLIVRALDRPRLRELREAAEDLGMAALVEVHDEEELDVALESGARIVGVNNRDLRSFETDVRVTLDLVDRVLADRTLVSESGIGSGDHVRALGEAGVDAILVGETLLRADDPGRAADELVGWRRVARRDV